MSSTSGSDPEELTKSGRVPVGRPMRAFSEHKFQVHNYKRPTFCAHCGGLLVGVVRQGLRCKRCEVDVHEKCQEDLNKQCVEVIVGNHNFREKSYTKPTFCDYCEKLLVGVVNQGLKCTECGANVHERCQEKIEVSCEKFKERLQASRTSLESPSKGLQRGRETRRSQRRGKPNETTPLTPKHQVQEEEIGRNYTQSFQTMPGSDKDQGSGSSDGSKKAANPPATQLLHQQVGEVTSIMQNNIKRIEMRQEKLEDLEHQSDKIVEGANRFKINAEKIKNKYWWQNKKMWIGIAIAVIILITVIIVVIVLKYDNGSKTTSSETTASNSSG